LNSLKEEDQINYFKQQLEKVGFLPANTDIRLVNALLEVWRVQAQINYVPENILLTPITLFQSERTFQQQDFSKFLESSAFGWDHFANSEVEIHKVPGNHMSMLGEPHIKVLAEKLQQSLLQALSKFSK